MMSIVTTGPDTGYYADVFRSRKERGGDKMHDYFYHNLGQSMTLTAVDGTDMNLQPTEELAFAGADLYAYSYLYDNVNSKACISLRIHVNITRKRNALQRTFSSRRAFLLVRVRFILLFYLDDVIGASPFFGVNFTAVTGFLFTTLCTVCCFPFEVNVLFWP